MNRLCTNDYNFYDMHFNVNDLLVEPTKTEGSSLKFKYFSKNAPKCFDIGIILLFLIMAHEISVLN